MKNPVAAILSVFVPGLGQLINGQWLKAIILFALVVLTFPTVILPFIFWIISIVDAYNGR